MSTKQITTTIAEPFPVMFGHVNCKPEHGPFYAAGSRWFDRDSDRARRHATARAERLRAHGYTVTVDFPN